MDLIQFLQREWATLSAAPFTFITTFVLALVAGYFVTRWRYEGRLDVMRERLEMLKERLDVKDQQLTEYRERLHLQPSTTAYSMVANADLKRRAMDVVTHLREFLAEYWTSGARVSDSFFMKLRSATSDDEKRKIANEHTQQLLEDSAKVNAEYFDNVRFKGMLLG
jgi:hypothetical protein